MSNASAYEAINDNPRLFIAYGGTVSDALEALAGILRANGKDDVELVSLSYNRWDDEHTVTAVVTI